MKCFATILCVFFLLNGACCQVVVSPQASETRQVLSLDGLWKFRTSPVSDPDQGFKDGWAKKGLMESKNAQKEVIDMPVPASYNDITQNRNLRDYVGWAWYERTFFLPLEWQHDKAIFARFGSAHYSAQVFINGQQVCSHSGGHLPFGGQVKEDALKFGSENRISVAVNNTLTQSTVPQGKFVWKTSSDRYPKGYHTLDYEFDFLNYAGIHRPVNLVAIPKDLHVNSVKTATAVADDLKTAVVYFDVDYYQDKSLGNSTTITQVQLTDMKGNLVGTPVAHRKGNFTIPKPNLWWPHTLSNTPGYQYQLIIKLANTPKGKSDSYRQKVGIRSLNWNATGIYVNHKKVYLRGYGRHDDSDIRGKGLDLPTITKDFNLMRWTGGNSFRTSHYPYAEEVMDFADAYGFMVIDECPAVAIHATTDNKALLDNHKQALTEMILRDQNRPSVIMWSLANEPRLNDPKSKDYFMELRKHVLGLDKSRPVTAVLNGGMDSHAEPALDVIHLNRYYSWYSDTGHTELIYHQMINNLKAWHLQKKKPIVIAEYGADCVPGLHLDPPQIFSEEYQTEFMSEYFRAFDDLKKQGVLSGEMVWNFADFMTKQQLDRVGGNKKGIFTRQRQPKAAAHLIRERYWNLAKMDKPKGVDIESMTYAVKTKKEDFCARIVKEEEEEEEISNDIQIEY